MESHATFLACDVAVTPDDTEGAEDQSAVMGSSKQRAYTSLTQASALIFRRQLKKITQSLFQAKRFPLVSEQNHVFRAEIVEPDAWRNILITLIEGF